MTEPGAEPRGYLRPLFFAAGCVFTAIGIAGVLLPLLPGTVFLILAAACFARSSRRLEHWLVTHPKLGPQVMAWRRTGAIATRVKAVAIASMAASYVLIWMSGAPLIARILSGAFLVASAVFVATRPVPPPFPPES